MKTMNFIFSFLLLLPAIPVQAQTLSATEIIRRTEENRQGKSYYSEIKMTIVRPTWSRELELKSWSKGDDYMLAVITAPAKEKGQAFLKRDKDLWNWMPSIGRMIKMSSSVMGQSWMGSDFTNDDMVKQSSAVKDYTHSLEKEEKIREYDCYKIILIPKENAPVVWGKVITWVTKDSFIEIKTESYDEDGVLVNTINGFDVQQYGKRKLPSRMEIIPAEKPNQKTVMTILKYDFDRDIQASFFSQQNMKKAQ